MTFPLRSWRFICVSSVLFYSLMATELCSAYFLALKIFHNSILTFSSKCYPIKSNTGVLHSQASQEATLTLSGTQERYVNSRSPHFCSLNFYSRPLQNAEQKPLWRMNSMENKTSFMKSVVHGCQVDHSYWIYDSIHLVRRLVAS